MTDPRKKLEEDLDRLVADDAAHKVRTAACREMASGIARAGQLFWVAGWLFSNDSVKGLGVLSEIGGELARSTVALLDEDLGYGAAALVRQLVEVEYLAWAFCEDSEVAARWYLSSPADIRKMFNPAAMRKRADGRFRNEEYWTHCDIGGHPNPKAALLLPDHSHGFTSNRWQWIDLGQHLQRLWGFLVDASVSHDLAQLLPAALQTGVQAAIADWHDFDALAGRLHMSDWPP